MSPVPDNPPGAGDLVELRVGEAAHGGWCVARPDGHGRVIFVRHALPGERVRAVITQTTSKLARADAVEIIEAAASRVQPPCPQARPGGCGGCDWQHASLPAQRELKAAVVSQQLRRIAGLERQVTVEPVPGDLAGLGWRTRVKFAVRPDGAAGLRKHRSHEVVDVGDCPIAHPLVGAAEVTGRKWPGDRWVEVAAAPGSGDRAVLVWPRAGGPARNRGRGPAARRGPALGPVGGGYLRQHAAGRDWRVSATGFWQVHPGAADTLAAAVLDSLRPRPGEVALDLYCGAGLFTGVLAAAVGPAGTVIGMEQDRQAVRDARHNLRATPWARVHCGDAAELLAHHGQSGASLAVLDPPRTGASGPVIDLLSEPLRAGNGRAADGAASGLRRIAYVSCDPATLARDLAQLLARGWELHALRAFDAFPMTHHVECLVTLTRGTRQ